MLMFDVDINTVDSEDIFVDQTQWGNEQIVLTTRTVSSHADISLKLDKPETIEPTTCASHVL